MKSVRRGLREGEIEKDTFERLECAACGVRLGTQSRDDDVGTIRRCSECGREWQQV